MRLKELRKQNKLNQTDIAKVLQIEQNTYSKYEIGKAEPNISNLIKLADYYQVSIDYLVGREWVNDLGYMSSQLKEIVKMGQQLNEIELLQVNSFMMGLLVNKE